MSDSTPYLDASGIRRDHPILPTRHALPTDGLQFLGHLADLGAPGSIERLGWENLLRVHGFVAVLCATARCYHQVDATGKVRNEQAQAVLDGKLPGGHGVMRHATTHRQAKVA
jgi:hypothetical protein